MVNNNPYPPEKEITVSDWNQLPMIIDKLVKKVSKTGKPIITARQKKYT